MVFPDYDSVAPTIPAATSSKGILLFSKTTGFRHGEAIEKSKETFATIANRNDWFLFETENGAVFNSEQLKQFKVVIWNNVTGGVLTKTQRQAFKEYIDSGGSYMGIHGSGDFSHPWDWYVKSLIGVEFSGHMVSPHQPVARMKLEACTTDSVLCYSLPEAWDHADEWYSFTASPRKYGFEVLYTLDENTYTSSTFLPDKDNGRMGDHPIVWYKQLEKGKVFYSALGHSAASFEEEPHIQMLENALFWLIK